MYTDAGVSTDLGGSLQSTGIGGVRVTVGVFPQANSWESPW